MNKQELLSKYESKINSYYTDMKDDVENAENELELLDVFLEFLPSDLFIEIINNELTTSDPDFGAKLQLMKKIMEADDTLRFDIPAMAPLPKQKKLSHSEAEELAQKSAKIWTEKRYGGESEKIEDLVSVLLLCNEFEVSDTEKDLIKRLKGSSNKASWFGFSGANIWPSVRVLTTCKPDPYLLANLSLRLSYFDKKDREPSIRNLQYADFENLDDINDLRHLEQIVAQQKLVPGVDSKDYVASSNDWFDWYNSECLGRLNPQAIWPFFAENMIYIDRAMCIYRSTKTKTIIYTDYGMRILSYFPTLPERYYYRIWDFLLHGPNNNISYEAFFVLKNYPDFEEKLKEYAQSKSNVQRKRAELWLNELHTNPQPAAKRYFISKNGKEFWNIHQAVTCCVTQYGELDSTYPRRDVKSIISVGECKRFIDEKIKEQKAKGFKETDENGVANAILARNEKALKTIVEIMSVGSPLITPPVSVSINIDIKQTVSDASGKPYVCTCNEGILTDVSDVNYIKATLLHLIGYVAETKFDSTVPFIQIGSTVKNKFTPLILKIGKYRIENSFDVLCREAYKHAELQPYLVVLLQTISKVNEADEPIWFDEQNMLGMELAFLLAQQRQYTQAFMDYFHSIQSVDNHTHYSGEIDAVELPAETQMQLLAGFYANSICSGDMEEEALRRVKKFKKEQVGMFLAYLSIECKYNLDVRKWAKPSVANSVENYFSDFHKDKDTTILAKLFIDYINK